jgi:hypothetical protein
MARPAYHDEGPFSDESPRLHPRMQRLVESPATFDVPHGALVDAAPAAPGSAVEAGADTLVLHTTAVRRAVLTVRVHTRSIASKASGMRGTVPAADPNVRVVDGPSPARRPARS